LSTVTAIILSPAAQTNDLAELKRFEGIIQIIADQADAKPRKEVLSNEELDVLLGSLLSCKSDSKERQTIRRLIEVFRSADKMGSHRIAFIDASLAKFPDLTPSYRQQLHNEALHPPASPKEAPSQAVVDTLLSYDCESVIQNAFSKGVTRTQICNYAYALARDSDVVGLTPSQCTHASMKQ
jgi:hypothetical protein